MGLNHMSDWTDDEYGIVSGKTNSHFINSNNH